MIVMGKKYHSQNLHAKRHKNKTAQNKSAGRNILEGIIQTTSRGIGFVTVTGREEDIRIEQGNLNTALEGDAVTVLLKHGKDGVTGEVVRIVQRAKTEFVGTVRDNKGNFILEPQSGRMYATVEIPKEKARESHDGDKVVVRITEWTDAKKNPRGEVTEILGPSGEHETEMKAIVRDKGLAIGFPERVLGEAQDVKKNSSALLKTEIPKRRDFRGIPTFTIDPDDAKDFDDALSLRTLPNGNYEVGIHIADATFFVHEKGALDTEAAHRGTSIYLVDRTIPMFPETLSNDLCSLNEGEDKLTFSVILEMSPRGDILRRSFEKTVIHSNKRFTYAGAHAVVTSSNGPFARELKILDALAKNIRRERARRGVIEFEQDEIKFELDARGKPLRIFKKERLSTMKLIEDFMVLANNEVAKFMSGKDKNIERTFVYRVHALPDEDRMHELYELLRALGHAPRRKAGTGPITAHDINRILQDAEGKAHKNMVHMATLRAMAKAVYSTKNIGHFGLSLKHYTHFTSPIRRYPDIMVHRLLFRYLSGKPVPREELAKYEALSRYSTEMEIAAADAERASVKYKQAEYLASHVGKIFDGVITGITEHGIFVRENESFAEGIVRLRDMKDDYYVLDKTGMRLVGRKKRKTFSLGDAVRVRLKGVDIGKRLIDYELA